MTWKENVACPQRLQMETIEFLDQHADKGKLNRSSTFTIKDSIGAMVPFEILPLKIKKLVTLMPIKRSQFKTGGCYRYAQLNLYIYGYMPDVDKALIMREQHWRVVRLKFAESHSKKRLISNISDKRLVHNKENEDFSILPAVTL